MISPGTRNSSQPHSDRLLDTLIIAGGPGVEAAAADTDLVRWVQSRALSARRFASVCTGAVLLASTGLLDGRRATTHWSLCSELARRFPAVRVESVYIAQDWRHSPRGVLQDFVEDRVTLSRRRGQRNGQRNV